MDSTCRPGGPDWKPIINEFAADDVDHFPSSVDASDAFESEVDIKDPTISCDLFGESGTRIGAVRETLLEIVPAGGTKRFTELNMGFMGSTQTANYRCEIIDAEAIP